jgi:endo-1,4-beta-xylanase
VTITEFDVKESDARAPVDVRDQRVAQHARAYLEVVFAQPAVRGLVTWGLSDKYSWLSSAPGPSGEVAGRNRGLPYDEGFAPKPMHAAIRSALTSARDAGVSFRKPVNDSAV